MIKTGTVDCIWDDSFKQFDYVRQPIKPEEIIEWRKMGYTHDTFSGVMYGGRNPMPAWTLEVADQMGMKNPGFVFYKMSTLEIMPPHVDHFETYSRVFNVPRERVFRGLVMLENWKPGHYLEMDKVGVVNWMAGDYFIWSADIEHAASNIGVEPRYTLQITGEYIE